MTENAKTWIVVLNDGETWTTMEGCYAVEVLDKDLDDLASDPSLLNKYDCYPIHPPTASASAEEPAKPQVIETDEQHKAALAEIERLIIEPNPERSYSSIKLYSDRLKGLATLVENYEKEHFPIPRPTPEEALQFRAEQSRPAPEDLPKYTVEEKQLWRDVFVRIFDNISGHAISDLRFPQDHDNKTMSMIEAAGKIADEAVKEIAKRKAD